ncbi:glutathione S-transferase [Moesziomyces antarcticus]|uniref:DUF952 domain-containing protein n=1 Tax=Pseudozyma antarctica TaxID=84753 RepID=A0A5C3FEG4_PSEA2|nr:glutathione S-transferase [Moesziomyces antarcticus]GAK62274.1 glutathione S-transferase [Moesziomyces antarcticus]SPO42814.1 uncharacterized protein PSANT_00497 [Moesziomyces antarcticus]
MRDPTTCTVLYKILTPQEKDALPATNWAGTALDTKDGFIHLSSADQLAGTLERFFSPATGCGDTLYLYTFDRATVDKPRETPIKLQFDPAIGTFFGHIYGSINPQSDFSDPIEIKRSSSSGLFELPSLQF